MKKLLIICAVIISAASVWAWWVVEVEDVAVGITRVTTSETHITMPFGNSAYDLGDTDSSITAAYGGEPFSCGSPVQIEVIIGHPPAADTWDTITLQYYVGTSTGAPGSFTWITIGTITSGFDAIDGVHGCHFGMSWTPPGPGDYLVRIHGLTTGTDESALLGAPFIDKDGDGSTWDDREVVGFTVTANVRPGVQPR